MKKPKQRELPFLDNYTFHSIQHNVLNRKTSNVCDNCGMRTGNTASISNEAGQFYVVGLDCLAALSRTIINKEVYHRELRIFDIVMRFMSDYKKAYERTIQGGSSLVIRYKNYQGKDKMRFMSIHTLNKFNIPYLITQ